MTNSIIFIFYFYFLLLSVLGYGLIFQSVIHKNLNNFNHESIIYLGFSGICLITLISLITSLVVPHNYIHNIILHFIGFLTFIFNKSENKLNYLKYLIIISLIIFSAILISKTHDDFSYYHLPFTKYLTEQKIIFGMGHLNHGYNLLSSLFFLNSTFYLPFIQLYSFHFSLIFFLIFFNFFLIKEILLKKNHELTKFLYLFCFVFFNLSFNRLAEFGTDKAGQLLIVLLVIKFFQYSCIDKKKLQINNILFLIPLLAYCITLKTYFISYLILAVMILLLSGKFVKNFKLIIFSRSFFYMSLLLLIYYFHHFISTGCLISPLPSTCLDSFFSWSRDKYDITGLSVWLEQWAKAGAGPDFRVDDLSNYIKKLNWLPNWYERYFLIKFLDQLGILFFSFLLIFIIFKSYKTIDLNKVLNKNVMIFFSCIIIIFSVWLFKHPTLRYGGYPIVFLLISFPVSFLFYKFVSKNFFQKKFKLLVIIVIILFNFKNIYRINKELNRDDIYKFSNFPFFAIENKDYKKNYFESGLTIYQAHHCWATPTPCGHVNEKTTVIKKNGYFFINKTK